MTAGDVAEPPSWFEASEQVPRPAGERPDAPRARRGGGRGRAAPGDADHHDGGRPGAGNRTERGPGARRVRGPHRQRRRRERRVGRAAHPRMGGSDRSRRRSPRWRRPSGSATWERRRCGDLSGGSGFAGLSSVDRLAYATAVSPDPFSPGIVAAMRAGAGVPDAVRGRVHDGDRHLELGCGVAGRILCVLQAFPTLTAVGVELAPDLAAEAERRAAALGVADRFEVVCADATTVRLDGTFDVASGASSSSPGQAARGPWRPRTGAAAGRDAAGPAAGGRRRRRESDPHGSTDAKPHVARVVHGRLGRSRPVARRSGGRGRAGRLRRRRGQCRGGRRCPRGESATRP